MTTSSAASVGSDRKAPRRTALHRKTAMRLAATEYERWADALDAMQPDQWELPTDCTGWDVHDLTGHIVGMAEMAASLIEQARQQATAGRRAKKSGRVLIDELTDLQVRKHAGHSPDQLRARMRAVGPKAARGRRRTPGFVRGRTMPVPQLLPGAGVPEWWSFGYLVDTILTRDPWMHRIDLSHALNVPMRLTADHDGVIVADVVAEWAQRHGQPYRLRLTGAAGGTWSWGDSGPDLELDALDFCRAISGRGPAHDLLATHVPF